MASKEGANWLCCTWEGLDRVKRFTALGTGIGVLISSILTLLNPADTAFKPLSFVRSGWNAMFGLLMILVQIKWTNWINRRFGFMSGWFGRALFFIFVGTNIMEPDSTSAVTAMLTIVAGVACLFVGVVELIFGFRCAEGLDGSGGSGGSGKDGASELPLPSTPSSAPGKQTSFVKVFGGGPSARGPQSTPVPPPNEPTFTINVSASQALEGAKMAAAAAPPAKSSAEPNPFYGNSHLPGI